MAAIVWLVLLTPLLAYVLTGVFRVMADARAPKMALWDPYAHLEVQDGPAWEGEI